MKALTAIVFLAAAALVSAQQPNPVLVNPSTNVLTKPTAAQFRTANDLLGASTAATSYQPLDSDLTSWAGITRASGFDTFVATPSGANFASLLTTALPASKGGTGLTSLAANVVTLLGAADYAAMRTQLSLVPGTDVQAYDADLASIAGNTTGGFLTRTAAGTYTPRTITGTPGQITVTNGDGVSGNPTISLPSTITQATTFSQNLTSSARITSTVVGTSSLDFFQANNTTGRMFDLGTNPAGQAYLSLRDQTATAKLTLTGDGSASFSSTTASTSTTTGSATFGGGIGVAGAGYFGGAVNSKGQDLTQTFQTRAVDYYLLSDGATANRAMVATLNAATNPAGRTIQWSALVYVPTSNPTSNAVLFQIGAATTDQTAAANAFTAFIGATSADLYIQQRGPVASDRRYFRYPGFRTSYSGQWVILSGTTYGDSPTNPIITANGVDISGSFALTLEGSSVPNWLPTTLAATYFVGAYNWPAGAAPLVEWGFGEWSLTECATWARTGVKPSWWVSATGNAARFVSDFSTATGWTVSGATTIAGGKLNLSENDAAYFSAASNMALSANCKYSFTATVDSITSGGVYYWNGSSYIQFATTPGTYTVDFTSAASYSAGPALKTLGGNAVLDSYTGRILGPAARNILQPSSVVVPDYGANAISTTLTAGMSAVGRFSPWSVNASGATVATTVVSTSNTTDATAGGAGSLTTAGGIYAAKKIITPSTMQATGGYVGSATNDNADAGEIGEYVSAVGSQGHVSGVTYDVASITLTAGDWDVFGTVEFYYDAASVSEVRACSSSTSATMVAANSTGGLRAFTLLGGSEYLPLPVVRYSLASTTTIYLPVKAAFSSGSVDSNVTLRARRVR